MPRDVERQMDDYLDGRLSDAERREFEAAMATDASLAAEVAGYRAMGEALRADDDEPGEGFYAKARERFENARRPWIERLWSWEAASLLAAAVLAFALFGPAIFDDGLSDEASGAAVVTKELDRIDPRSDGAAPAPEAAPAEVAGVESRIAAEGFADEAVAGEPAPPSAAAVKKATPGKAERREREAPGKQVAPEPTAISESLRAASPTASMDARRELELAVVRMPQPPPAPITLPTLEEWRRMASDPGFPTLASLGPPSAERRLLWVGGALDCDRLTATIEAGAWRLALHPGDDVACALLIPADGLPVTVAPETAP